MKLTTIAAIGKNGELGLKNDMPWKRALQKDLHFFKEMTWNHPVVMGKNTFKSIGKPLPGRTNIVITHEKIEDPSVCCYQSLEDFLNENQDSDQEFFIIGGASLYRQLIEQSQRIILTEIDGDFEADCFFPKLDRKQYTYNFLGSDKEAGYDYNHIELIKKA